MDISKALTYPFEDPDWTMKLGIAAGISLLAFIAVIILPIVGLVVLIPLAGWSIETMKRVRSNEPNPLADWNDFGGLIKTGLTPFLAGIVYQIPTLLVYCGAVGYILVLVVSGSNDNLSAMLGGAASLIFGCCLCLVLIYSLVASVVYWGGLMRYLDKEEFGTFMEFGPNFRLVQENMGDFGMALLYTLIGGLIMGVLFGVPCIGWAAAYAFAFYYDAHILGQLSVKLAGAAKPAM